MQPTPPPPPVLAVPKAATSAPTQPGKSLQDLMREKQLKQTEGPQVRGLGLKVVNVLLVTKFWGCYNWLSEGMKLVLITSKEAEEARQAFINDPENPRTAFTEVVVAQDYSHGGEVEVLAHNLHTKYNFTHVIVHTENDLIRAARIRGLLNLKTGQSLENAIRYRDKVVMKTVCASKGLSVPTFATVEGASDVLGFVKKHGLPVVVKPKMGYSSVDTTILREMSDVENFCKTGLYSPGIDPIFGLEVEKFVLGPMYHIDGFVFDGKVVVSWPSEYIGTVVKFKTNPYIAGYSLASSNPLVGRLNEYIEKVITALGSDPHPNPRHFPFHAEAWVTPEDDIVLCEIASRGDVEAFGTWRSWLPKVDYLVGWSYIYPKKGVVKKFPVQDPATKEWSTPLPDYCLSLTTWLEEGQSFGGPKDCADTCCATLVKGKDEEEVKHNIQAICDWFWGNTTWVEQ